MYFALNQNIDSIETYISFLRDIIESNNEYYKKIFKEIIDEAKRLKTTKDYYSINRERFGIISVLADKTELLDSLDSTNLNEKDFLEMLSVIEGDNVAHIS